MRKHSSAFGRRVLPAVAIALVSTASLSAQKNTTALRGTVTDTTGALMPGVSVSLSNPANGAELSTKTQNSGEFSFDQISPGKYTLKISAPGFSQQEQDVELLVATPVKLNFQLSVGSSDIVNVETTSAVLNSTDAALGKAFNTEQVENLPYLANNVTYLLSLQPGVLALDGGSQSGGVNTDTRTGIVNGARSDQSNITLDGVDNNDPTLGYAFSGALRATRESVEEFRVTTSNPEADQGRSSGAQVSLVTRSGTNQIHGTAYEYYRGVGLSNNFFNKQSQLASGRGNRYPKVIQNTFGASFGAPIIKDKLFFFGAYEGFKQASSQVVSRVVPSVLGGGGLVTGNVSYAVCPTSAACSTSTTYKTLNSADIAAIDPKCTANKTCPNGPGTNAAAIAYFKQFPLANSPASGAADGVNTGIYTFASSAPISQITNIARVDYNISSHQTLFVRGNLQQDNVASTLQFPGLPAASLQYGNNKGIAVGHIFTLGDHMTNNFRYGLVRQGTASRGTGSLPYVSFSAFAPLTATSTSSVYIITTNNFADDFTITKGKHTIQFGVNDRLLSNSRYFDSPLQTSGAISATLLATAAIAGKGTSLDPGAFNCTNCGTVATSFRTFYNAAILANTGIIEQAQSGTEYYVRNNQLVPAGAGVVPTHVYHNLEQEYYVQDQWRATPRLTLTAGVRYAYFGTPYEINGQQIAPTVGLQSLLQNRMAAAAAGQAYNARVQFQASGSANGAPNFWNPQKLNFAPRVAFAYATADNKTSIRGGFAINYDHQGEGIINFYEATSSSLLSLSKTNQFVYTDVDTNPRFTGYRNVPLGTVNVAAIQLPATPADIPFSFLRSINNNIQTPYAETFNLTVQHELSHGLTVTGSYVGRLGRHLLANLDVAQPTNLYDPLSGQTYYQAAQAFDKAYDAGVGVAQIPNSGYFANIFPNASYKGYKGAQAYYAYLSAGDRGNETDPLFTFDTGTSASPSGQSFRFFYPQTSSIFVQSTIASSNYNALQLSMRHALRYGMVYDVNYTLSKSLDQGSAPERSAGNLITDTLNPRGNYAVSDFDARHNISANWNAPLPFGHGMAFLSNTNGLLDRLIGGFQTNGVVHYSTGFPYSAVASGNYGTNFLTSSFFVKTAPIPTGGHRYDSAKNQETTLKGLTSAQAIANLRYPYAGETGQRNAFRADGYLSIDVGVSKTIRTFKEQGFRLSLEVFNVINTNRFNVVTTNGASPNFGTYGGTAVSNITSASANPLLLQPRQMQISGKYTF